MRSTLVRPFAALAAIFLASAFHGIQAQTSLPYQKPPQAIIDLVDTRPTPNVNVSPKDSAGSQWLLIELVSGLPSLADLAQPEFRLAGLRFNPRTNGPSRGRYITSLMLQALPNGEAKPVSGIPSDAKIRFAAWSADARHVAFVNTSDNPSDAGLSLWIIDVASAQARAVPGVALNGIFGRPCEWSSDNASLICKTVPKGRGPAPKRTEVPTGPVIQENLGRITPGPTYEDLLKNPEDEQVFDYYADSQIQVVHLDGTTQAVGEPGVIESASPSPDARYVLVDERHHPYSYLLPFRMFPERFVTVNLASGASRELADKPLEDTVPNIHDAVATGPREFDWRSDAPATVSWVEAGDGGDPRKDVPIHDSLFLLDAPFDGSPRKLAEIPLRFRGLTWGNGHLALVEERRWKDRKRIILAVSPDSPATAIKLFEGSFEDRYHDPGEPAVMGHSYGAFMTANLLAHSDLFRAGIARSGAYNRTLTPFGFQNEERTYWQAPEIYYKMSPFSYADKIKTPILLIHGEADNNSGTFPLQSERLFSAIKGQGGTVRFVLLPLESHGYAGRESVLHMFWEMNNWMTAYVKNPPQSTAAAKP